MTIINPIGRIIHLLIPKRLNDPHRIVERVFGLQSGLCGSDSSGAGIPLTPRRVERHIGQVRGCLFARHV
jgi:hypothetical protein